MKKIFFLSLFALLFLAVKCPKPDNPPSNIQTKKQPDVLPPATQTGANTYGCLLNGKVWLPGGIIGNSSLDVQYYKGLFFISAGKKMGDTVLQAIRWSYKPVYGPGTYYFKNAPSGGPPGAGFADYKNTSCGNYQAVDKDSLQNWVTVTKLDSVNRIVSGTFNLFFTENGCDTLRITNGRFDAIYFY